MFLSLSFLLSENQKKDIVAMCYHIIEESGSKVDEQDMDRIMTNLMEQEETLFEKWIITHYCMNCDDTKNLEDKYG
jgi:hypothetical protein